MVAPHGVDHAQDERLAAAGAAKHRHHGAIEACVLQQHRPKPSCQEGKCERLHVRHAEHLGHLYPALYVAVGLEPEGSTRYVLGEVGLLYLAVLVKDALSQDEHRPASVAVLLPPHLAEEHVHASMSL